MQPKLGYIPINDENRIAIGPTVLGSTTAAPDQHPHLRNAVDVLIWADQRLDSDPPVPLRINDHKTEPISLLRESGRVNIPMPDTKARPTTHLAADRPGNPINESSKAAPSDWNALHELSSTVRSQSNETVRPHRRTMPHRPRKRRRLFQISDGGSVD